MKQVIALLMLALPLWTFAAERVVLRAGAEDVTVSVVESTPRETILRFEVGAFTRETITIEGRSFALLDCGKEGIRAVAGEPALPHINRSVIIPDAEEVEIRVLESEYQDFLFSPVAPSKGHLLRTVDPASVPYSFGPVYNTNAWYPAELATLGEPYILRDLRGVVVELNAFQYQPAEQTLRVYTSVTVAVTAAGPGEENVLLRREPFTTVEPGFDLIYRRQFVNYGMGNALLYVPVLEEGEMLIITHDAFREAMIPFRNWKIQKGIPVTMVNVSTIGNTSTAIRTYIQNFYNNTAGNLAHVLLVGDAAQVATPSASGGSSDPTYAKVAGTDYYPDIFVGRFSAETLAHVQTQVERSVEYERDPHAGDAWYHLGTGVASAEGPGHFSEYDYQHMNLIRTDLLGFTYTAIDQIYDPGATAAQVTTVLNAGRSLVNYTGHGSSTAWTTTGFSNSHVAALQNDNHLPFVYSVACVNGQFAGATCFAEAWLRSTRNGEPVGAVATYMSSINQLWNPPMDAQDEACDLMRAVSKTTVGGICYNSSCRMIEINGADGADMYNTWHIFGDPSLQVRTNTPAVMTVSHPGEIFFGQPGFDVSIAGLAGALCALAGDSVLYGSAYTNAGGLATLNITGELPVGETLHLTVTAFNKLTYRGEVTVVTSGPDLWPPSISFTPLADTDDATGPYALTATIRDYSGISSATLYVGFNGLTFQPYPMTQGAGDTWNASFGGYPAGTTAYYFVSARDASENLNCDSSAVFDFSVLGLLLADDMESGESGWTHAAISAGWADQWHVSTEQAHGGTHAWKFGDPGTGTYANHAYGELVTPAVTLVGEATLTFWHWMQGEVSTAYPDSAYDGGVVDIAVDGGAWTQLLTLNPTYNKITRCAAGGGNPYTGPFTCRTACYSGDLGWTQVSAVLDSYAGHTIRLRFRFGSDNGGAREGWYVDDLAILGLPPLPVEPDPVAGLQTMALEDGSVLFFWPPVNAPQYRLYSAPVWGGPYDLLEATVTDTFVTLPTVNSMRFYIVRAATAE